MAHQSLSFGKDVCDLFGIDANTVSHIAIELGAGEIPRVTFTVDMYEPAPISKLTTLLTQYELAPIAAPSAVADDEAVGA